MRPLGPVLWPVFLVSCSEFVLKYVANLQVGDSPSVVSLLTHPFFWVGIGGLLLGGLLWLVALSKYPLSFAYPFLSINYIVVVLGSWGLFHEPLSWYRIVGLGWICLGLVFISKSPR